MTRNELEAMESLREQEWCDGDHRDRLHAALMRAPEPTRSETSGRRRAPTLAVLGVAGAGVAFAGMYGFDVINFSFDDSEATADASPASTDAPDVAAAPDIRARPEVEPVQPTDAPIEVVSGATPSAPVLVHHDPTTGVPASAETPSAGDVSAMRIPLTEAERVEHVDFAVRFNEMVLWGVENTDVRHKMHVHRMVTFGELREKHPHLVGFAADLDGDGALGPIDVARFAEGYLLGDADVNADGMTDVTDYITFTEQYFEQTQVVRRDAEPQVVSAFGDRDGWDDHDQLMLREQVSRNGIQFELEAGAVGEYLIHLDAAQEAYVGHTITLQGVLDAAAEEVHAHGVWVHDPAVVETIDRARVELELLEQDAKRAAEQEYIEFGVELLPPVIDEPDSEDPR